jgi:tRNA 2-thiouridine synthesizing protein A
MMRHELDARRLLCPLPVIRVQEKVRTLPRGDTVDVLCTDPGALNDIPAWCRINGHKLVATRAEEHHIIITIEVG